MAVARLQYDPCATAPGSWRLVKLYSHIPFCLPGMPDDGVYHRTEPGPEMGILFTNILGFLFTIALGIQFTISGRARKMSPSNHAPVWGGINNNISHENPRIIYPRPWGHDAGHVGRPTAHLERGNRTGEHGRILWPIRLPWYVPVHTVRCNS